jgi:uncharacterized membrane protein
MKPSKTDLIIDASKTLEDRWGFAVITFLVYLLITKIVPQLIAYLLNQPVDFFSVNLFHISLVPTSLEALYSTLIGGPMTLGAVIFALALSRQEEANLEQIFDGFDRFGTAVLAMLLISVFVALLSVLGFAALFLTSFYQIDTIIQVPLVILLSIPGIMAALSYFMTFFILADNESIGAMEAIRLSKNMMEGYRMDLFVLCLMFIGLALLSVLTCGIGMLWLYPFAYVTLAKFYDALPKSHQEADPILDSFIGPE